MLYVLRAVIVDDDGNKVNINRTKIGITENYRTFHRRKQNIRTGLPFDMEEWATFPLEGKELEDKVKAHFQGRMVREWIIAKPEEIMLFIGQTIGAKQWTTI